MKTGIFLKTHKMCQSQVCTHLRGSGPLMLDAKAFVSLDGPPTLPLRLRQRPSKACAGYHSHTSMFQTHFSHSQPRDQRGAQGTASSPDHAQHKRGRCACAQDNQSYSRVKTCLAPGGGLGPLHWAPPTQAILVDSILTTYQGPLGTKEW